MAHDKQKEYCLKIKNMFPNFFKNRDVLDVGALDINGSNRFLFENCNYLGIDIAAGKNVDLICKVHEFNPNRQYDTIISTECFEHDMFYHLSLARIVDLLTPGGLFIFTCATTGRVEHGTRRSDPSSAPLLYGEWADYYKNLTEKDITDVLDIPSIFKDFKFEAPTDVFDLYFYGIKGS